VLVSQLSTANGLFGVPFSGGVLHNLTRQSTNWLAIIKASKLNMCCLAWASFFSCEVMTSRTPRRLTQLLREIRKVAFKVTAAKMAAILNDVVRMGVDGPVFEFTEQTVKNIESGRIEVQYIHLECYANIFEVPTGVLLLISKFQHEPVEIIEETVRVLSEILLSTCEQRRLIDYQQLRMISHGLGRADRLGQIPSSVMRRSGSARPLTSIERLAQQKKSLERLGIDPSAGLELWDFANKSDGYL
jgi:hypothetical protein